MKVNICAMCTIFLFFLCFNMVEQTLAFPQFDQHHNSHFSKQPATKPENVQADDSGNGFSPPGFSFPPPDFPFPPGFQFPPNFPFPPGFQFPPNFPFPPGFQYPPSFPFPPGFPFNQNPKPNPNPISDPNPAPNPIPNPDPKPSPKSGGNSQNCANFDGVDPSDPILYVPDSGRPEYARGLKCWSPKTDSSCSNIQESSYHDGSTWISYDCGNCNYEYIVNSNGVVIGAGSGCHT